MSNLLCIHVCFSLLILINNLTFKFSFLSFVTKEKCTFLLMQPTTVKGKFEVNNYLKHVMFLSKSI